MSLRIQMNWTYDFGFSNVLLSIPLLLLVVCIFLKCTR